jgi:hypothetical protein
MNDQKAIEACDLLITWLADNYVSSDGGCQEQVFGCCECMAIRLSQELTALKNSIGVEE